MKKILLLLLLNLSANAVVVNRLNGGGSVRYVDFSLPSSLSTLELIRTYNSITAINENTGWIGAFGWGWTAPFETTLTTTPERHVILRDGQTGNTVVFKPEKTDPQAQAEFYEVFKKAYFERERKKSLSNEDLAKLQLPDKIISQIKNDPKFRLRMASVLGINTKVPQGDILTSTEYGYQTIQFKNNQWIREKDGITQIFDKEGKLIRQTESSGFYFNFKYSTGQRIQLTEISDATRAMILKFTWRGERVIEVSDNKNQKAKYSYDGSGNLISAVDSLDHVFTYKYENRKFPHLLTKVEYTSEGKPGHAKPFRDLGYDDGGLIVLHRDKDGSETRFVYGRNQNDPENNFWTKETTVDRGGKNFEQYYEFFIRTRPDGTKYLAKQIYRTGTLETTTVFTQCCGKPQQTISNGKIVNFKYTEGGMLSEKVGPGVDLKIRYDDRWRKPAQVTYNGLISNYTYDGQGNLVRAMNNKNASVSLRYDKFGHITEMVDLDGRKLSFKYNDSGKPTLITEKGIGALKIQYAFDGTIEKTETVYSSEKNERKPSTAKSQEVVKRIMKGFQNLLDILRPAGMSLDNT